MLRVPSVPVVPVRRVQSVQSVEIKKNRTLDPVARLKADLSFYKKKNTAILYSRQDQQFNR